MDFKINSGELVVNFTEDEINRLNAASGNPATFEGIVDDIIESSKSSDECCARRTLYNRLPYEALHAVTRSEQVGSTILNASEVHLVGAKVGLSMFGRPR